MGAYEKFERFCDVVVDIILPGSYRADIDRFIDVDIEKATEMSNMAHQSAMARRAILSAMEDDNLR